MALKRSRNCLPLARTMSATSMAGLLMNDVADDRRDYTGPLWTASVLQSGWRPAAGAAARGEDIGLSPLDPHDRAEAGWCAGRCRLPAGVWRNYVERGAGLWAYECRPLSPPSCTPATPSCR